MSAFAAAVDMLFLDPNLAVDAVYRQSASGEGIPIRVIRSAPDQVADFNGGRFISDSIILDVRVSDVSEPRRGDRFEIVGGPVMIAVGDGTRDSERLVWKVEAREVAG